MRPDTLEELVSRQVRLWEEQRRQEEGRAAAGRHRHRPVVVVSREYGALGGTIGRLAAERLGFSWFDRDVVDAVARTAHVRRAVVESVDERIRDAITTWVAEMFGIGLDPGEYLRNLARVILSAAQHGHAVMVGRGAQFILDRDRTLAVRAIAPLDVRVERVARHKHLSASEARQLVARVDGERTEFIRRNFGRDVRDPSGYDLVLDTGYLPVDTCADLVATAFRGRFGEPAKS